MPKPPLTGGRIRIDDGLHDIVELTPRDSRGVPLALLERRAAKANGEGEAKGGAGADDRGDSSEPAATSRSRLSTVRSASTSSRPSSSRRPLTAVNSLPNLRQDGGGGGGGGGGRPSSSNRAGRPRQEKPAEWQQWVIKSRQTWVRSAQRTQVARKAVDLRGGVMNRSHPKVPLLWQNNGNGNKG